MIGQSLMTMASRCTFNAGWMSLGRQMPYSESKLRQVLCLRAFGEQEQTLND